MDGRHQPYEATHILADCCFVLTKSRRDALASRVRYVWGRRSHQRSVIDHFHYFFAVSFDPRLGRPPFDFVGFAFQGCKSREALVFNFHRTISKSADCHCWLL